MEGADPETYTPATAGQAQNKEGTHYLNFWYGLSSFLCILCLAIHVRIAISLQKRKKKTHRWTPAPTIRRSLASSTRPSPSSCATSLRPSPRMKLRTYVFCRYLAKINHGAQLSATVAAQRNIVYVCTLGCVQYSCCALFRGLSMCMYLHAAKVFSDV